MNMETLAQLAKENNEKSVTFSFISCDYWNIKINGKRYVQGKHESLEEFCRGIAIKYGYAR